MDTGAAMPRFHVRPTGAVAEIMYADRAQVLNQLACSNHVRPFACQYLPIVPLTRLRHHRLKFANGHPNYDIFSPRGQLLGNVEAGKLRNRTEVKKANAAGGSTRSDLQPSVSIPFFFA